jgi:hypothetical protein
MKTAKRIIYSIRLFFEAIGYIVALLLILAPIYSDPAPRDKRYGYEVYRQMIEGIRKGFVGKTIMINDFEIYWTKSYSRAISRDRHNNIIAVMFIFHESNGFYTCYGAPTTKVPTLYCDGENQFKISN